MKESNSGSAKYERQIGCQISIKRRPLLCNLIQKTATLQRPLKHNRKSTRKNVQITSIRTHIRPVRALRRTLITRTNQPQLNYAQQNLTNYLPERRPRINTPPKLMIEHINYTPPPTATSACKKVAKKILYITHTHNSIIWITDPFFTRAVTCVRRGFPRTCVFIVPGVRAKKIPISAPLSARRQNEIYG